MASIRNMMDEVDLLIEKILKKSKDPLSTYDITKKAGVSWSTVNTHLYKLQALGLVDVQVFTQKIGERKRKMWKLKKS